MSRVVIFALIGLFLAVLAPIPGHTEAPSGAQTGTVLHELLERECLNLNGEKLQALLVTQLGPEVTQGPSPDLLRIMEGVIKRTDFDGIAEEKTAEIIGLVNGAYKKGAPLEFLDEIFDVAYVNTVTVDQLAAAAEALQEFHHSDVPQDIYEEFVYHSIEDGWEPSQLPVYTRGLIYGVERGLSPDKVALVIMLDVRNGEAAKKPANQVVLDALKLVREKEPEKWRPLSKVEREMEERQDQVRSLERRRQELEGAIEENERAMVQAQVQLKELREYPAQSGADIDVEKLNRDLELLLRKLQGEITQYQSRRRNVVTELETTRRDVERRQEVRDSQRRARKERELAQSRQKISSAGRSGRLNQDKLESTVKRYLGTPYRFGGDSERGIDCSAFTRRVYREQGVELPRTSREQARIGSGVAYGSVRPGDLVFFDTSITGGISHVGILLGSNTFAHASSSKGVTKSSLREKYYVKRFVKGGRIFAE